jgi:hypothetical protein
MSFDPDPTEQEVREAFLRYETALLANDIDELDLWFWDDPRIVRFGIADMQQGADSIARWRRASSGVPADRTHQQLVVTVFDSNTAVVALVFRNGTDPAVGRQSQLWRRIGGSWKVVHAHVSMMS